MYGQRFKYILKKYLKLISLFYVVADKKNSQKMDG